MNETPKIAWCTAAAARKPVNCAQAKLFFLWLWRGVQVLQFFTQPLLSRITWTWVQSGNKLIFPCWLKQSLKWWLMTQIVGWGTAMIGSRLCREFSSFSLSPFLLSKNCPLSVKSFNPSLNLMVYFQFFGPFSHRIFESSSEPCSLLGGASFLWVYSARGRFCLTCKYQTTGHIAAKRILPPCGKGWCLAVSVQLMTFTNLLGCYFCETWETLLVV